MAALTREEEKALIRRVLRGEQEAFEGLVLEYQKRIYNLTLRMTRNPSDAEDLTQEAFLKAYRSLENFRGESGFYVWIYRIASNLCIDFLRRENQRGADSLVQLGADEEEWVLEVPDSGLLPEELLERKELQQALKRELDALPPKQREILTMRGLGGLSYGEIAQVLGLEEGTVKSRISRARAALARRLQIHGNIFDSTASEKIDGR